MSISSHHSFLLILFSEKLPEQMFHSYCLCFLTLQFLFNSLDSGFCLRDSTEIALVKITVTFTLPNPTESSVSILFYLLAWFDVVGPFLKYFLFLAPIYSFKWIFVYCPSLHQDSKFHRSGVMPNSSTAPLPASSPASVDSRLLPGLYWLQFTFNHSCLMLTWMSCRYLKFNRSKMCLS